MKSPFVVLPAQSAAFIRTRTPSRVSRSRVALRIYGDGRAGRWRRQLNAVLLPLEVVSDIPELRRALVGDGFTTLNLLRGLRIPIAPHVRTDGGSGHRSSGRREILAPAIADLVAENAPNQCAGNCACNIRSASALSRLLAIHPAPLFGRADHCMH